LLIVGGLTPAVPLPNRILSRSWMCFVGRISYSLYLWHWPLIVFTAALYPHASGKAETRLAIFALTFVISTASYYAIERPFRKMSFAGPGRRRLRLGDEFFRLRLLAFPAAVLASAVALGFMFFAPNRPGHSTASIVPVSESDLPPAQATPSSSAADASPARERSSQRAPTTGSYDRLLARWQAVIRRSIGLKTLPSALQPITHHLSGVNAPCQDYRLRIVQHETQCTWGNPNAEHVAAITGDSHASMWLTALENALGPHVWAVHPFTRSWCGWAGAVLRGANKDCRALQSQTLTELKRLHVDLVVLAEVGVPPTQEMIEALSRFTAVAKHVVVIGRTPDIPSFFDCLRGDSDISACRGSLLSTYFENNLRPEQRAAALSNATFIDPTPWLCSGVICPPVIAGAPVFKDGDHLTAEFAPKLAPLLRQALREAAAI
jgi:hypothetical protein